MCMLNYFQDIIMLIMQWFFSQWVWVNAVHDHAWCVIGSNRHRCMLLKNLSYLRIFFVEYFLLDETTYHTKSLIGRYIVVIKFWRHSILVIAPNFCKTGYLHSFLRFFSKSCSKLNCPSGALRECVMIRLWVGKFFLTTEIEFSFKALVVPKVRANLKVSKQEGIGSRAL